MQPRRTKLLAVAALAAAFAASTRAAVHESLDYGHYEARAQPGLAVSMALNDATPFRPGGLVFHGATAWNIDWQVVPEQTGDGRCRVGDVKIRLRGEMMLPRLVGGDELQRRRFETYLVNLREHELGHYELGREAARRLEQQFYSMAPARSCSELHATARETGNRLLARYEALGDAYDLRTGHGRTQGAWLAD
jgi:predicted secreted Zn-dependent protease